MASAIDVLLDQVDWTCTKCGVSMQTGCACWDRTTAAQKQVVATAIRQRLQGLLRTEYRQLYHNRSARVSLPNHLSNMVTSHLRRLDREAPRGYGLLADDLPSLVADIRRHWEAYVTGMFCRAWAALGEPAQGALVQAVKALTTEELGRLVQENVRTGYVVAFKGGPYG